GAEAVQAPQQLDAERSGDQEAERDSPVDPAGTRGVRWHPLPRAVDAEPRLHAVDQPTPSVVHPARLGSREESGVPLPAETRSRPRAGSAPRRSRARTRSGPSVRTGSGPDQGGTRVGGMGVSAAVLDVTTMQARLDRLRGAADRGGAAAVVVSPG